jgi:flagellar motor switch protein FliN/FliY
MSDDLQSEEIDEFEVAASDGSAGGNQASVALLNDIELDATLQFGSRELALREVLELGPGDVVELDRHISEPVDLVVGDRIVARGEVVVASGNFALRITEVAAPQLRLESIRCLF